VLMYEFYNILVGSQTQPLHLLIIIWHVMMMMMMMIIEHKYSKDIILQIIIINIIYQIYYITPEH